MWDWNSVGEIALGVSLGLIVGGYVVAAVLRGLAYEVLSHPTVRSLARAADKLGSGGQGGGWLGKLASTFLGGGK